MVGNLEDAKNAEAAIRNDLVKGDFPAKIQVITLDDVWTNYLPWAKENKSSWKDDEYNYTRHLQPIFGAKVLDEIRPMDIEGFISGLKNSNNAQGKKFKPATIRHQIVLLRRLFNISIKWDLFQKINPVSRVTIPKIDNQITEFMTPEQTESLLKTLEEWPCRNIAAFVKFAFYTGLRRGELFKLKGEYVFPGKGGKQMEDFKSPWNRIRKAAGLPEGFRFHGLRHNYASHLVSNGVGLEIVKELMTHKDMITTQRYAHLLPGALKEAVEKSGKI